MSRDSANNRERAEELFARAASGSFVQKSSEADGEARPQRESHGRDRESGEHKETSSRYGGTRRDWHEPKDFRLKSATRKPRFAPKDADGKTDSRAAGLARGSEEGGDRRGPRASAPAKFHRPESAGRTFRPRAEGRPRAAGRPKAAGRPDRSESAGRSYRPVAEGRGDRSQSTGRAYRPKSNDRGERSESGGRGERSNSSGRTFRPKSTGRRDRSKAAPVAGSRPTRPTRGGRR